MSANLSVAALDWEELLSLRLPLFGHRNWIVIVDSAYPAQSNPGIETIATGADHLLVLKATLEAVQNSKHVRVNIYLDAELKSVAEQDAPGVGGFRKKLMDLIAHRDALELSHEQIISKLDECGALFRILILKSTLAIPYTSVFLELDCGYWNREAEERLRQSMARSNP
jgi:hypothetical protein